MVLGLIIVAIEDGLSHYFYAGVGIILVTAFLRYVDLVGDYVGAALLFFVFSLITGAVYTMNDMVDAEADRQHPVKRFRPIASGLVSPLLARGFLAMLLIVGFAGAAYGPLSFLLTVSAYFVLNIAYSFKLKQVPYLDVAIISAGFVLRVMAGGYGTYTQVSNYLFVCTALLALFLGFGKRRHELAAAQHSKRKQRPVLARYSGRGLDLALAVTAVATIATYAAYTLDARTQDYFKTEQLWITTGFVVLGVARFLHLVSKRPDAESPTQEMLKDGPFVGIVMAWAVVMLWFVYNLRPGS